MEETASSELSDKRLRDFLDEFLVVCPSCEQSARVCLLPDGHSQLSCLKCGRVDIASARKRNFVTVLGGPVDPYFRLPLWLQLDCEGEILWAYNRRHLAFLKEFVGAKLRDVGPPRKRNLGNQLPKWMLLAKNRDAVLQGIERLNAK